MVIQIINSVVKRIGRNELHPGQQIEPAERSELKHAALLDATVDAN